MDNATFSMRSPKPTHSGSKFLIRVSFIARPVTAAVFNMGRHDVVKTALVWAKSSMKLHHQQHPR